MNRAFFISLCILFIPFFSIANTLYVSTLAINGNNDGSSWDNAYLALQQALLVAEYGDSIWVMTGVYHPTSGTDRDVYFQLKNGVKLFGGFLGAEAALDQRDWEAYPTILDGDIGVPGDTTDNSYTVLYLEATDSNTVVDGFIIRNGNANHPDVTLDYKLSHGGGMYINARTGPAYPIIRNCIFRNNRALELGGGVMVDGRNSKGTAPVFEHCRFEYNHADEGGGLYRWGAGKYEVSPDFRNCTFYENTAVDLGGGLNYNDTEGLDTFHIVDCTFEKNITSDIGGGLFVFTGRTNGTKLVIRRCNFIDNKSDEGGGLGIKTGVLDTKFIAIDDCQFSGNHSVLTGGAFSIDAYNFNEPALFSLTGSNFTGNTSDNGAAIAWINFDYGTVDIQNCRFDSNISYGFIPPHFSPDPVLIFRGFEQQTNVNSCIFKKNISFGSFINTLSSFTCSNSIFYKNKFTCRGLITGSGESTLSNCVFANELVNNSAFLYLISSMVISNSVFLKESATSDTLSTGANSTTIRNCLLSTKNCFDLPDYITCGPGNIFNADPLLADTAQGDFSLLPCSPARNAGDNNIINQLGLTTDFTGNPRILENTVDMGAYETGAFSVSLDSVIHQGCQGVSSGGFIFNVQNGCAPFTVLIGPAGTVADTTPIVLQGLSAGNYELSIIDADGREVDFQASIQPAIPIVVQTQSSPVNCALGMPGSATVTASGGAGNFQYTWSNGTTGPSIDNVPAGTYQVSITDSNDCEVTEEVVIDANMELTLDATVEPVTCYCFADGSIEVLPGAGTAPFSWDWEGGQTISSLHNLDSGLYTVTLTDATGCTGQASWTISQPDSLVLEFISTDSLCDGTADGEITVFASGGVLPYLYEWSNGNSGQALTGLSPGSYALTVTDGNGCTSEGVSTIEAYPPISVDTATVTHATGTGVGDGAIDIQAVSGGSGSFSFLWSNGGSAQSLQNLLPGIYSLTITDEKGCSAVFAFTVDVQVANFETGRKDMQARIIPNPSSGAGSQLLIETEYPEELEIRIHDAFGKEVYAASVLVDGAGSSFELPTMGTAGAYFVFLKNEEGGKGVLRWVVVH